jgi:F-type H+-transporting ATPase subunit epsilon
MAETFKFELISPERIVVSAEVGEVIVPGLEGEFTVLPRHAPVIAMLRPGVVRTPELEGKLGQIYVRNGFAEVTGDRLTILSEQALPVSEVDRALVAQEIRLAEEDLAGAETDERRRQAQEALDHLRSLDSVLNMVG